MAKHILRIGIFLVVAGMIALGWYFFARTSLAQSLVPPRGKLPMLAQIPDEASSLPPHFPRGMGRGKRFDEEHSFGEHPSFDRSQGRAARELAESGVIPGLHGEWIDQAKPQGTGRMLRDRGIDVGKLLSSIGVHLGLIGLVTLIVFVLRKIIGLFWNGGDARAAVPH